MDLLRICVPAYCPYADLGRAAFVPGPVLALKAEGVVAVREAGRDPARDVDVEAEKPRSFLATVPLTLEDRGRELGGAVGRRVPGSPALSTRVRRTLVAGSGTDCVSGLSGSQYMGRNDLQLDGLCFVLAIGGGMPLRAFMLVFWSSARGRGGDEIWGRREAGLGSAEVFLSSWSDVSLSRWRILCA